MSQAATKLCGPIVITPAAKQPGNPTHTLPFDEELIRLLRQGDDHLFHPHPRETYAPGEDAYDQKLAKPDVGACPGRNIIADVSSRQIDNLDKFLYSPFIDSMRASPGFGSSRDAAEAVRWTAKRPPNDDSLWVNEASLKASVLRGTLAVANSVLLKVPFPRNQQLQYFDELEHDPKTQRAKHGLQPARIAISRSDVYLVSYGAIQTPQQARFSALAKADKVTPAMRRRVAMVIEFKPYIPPEGMQFIRDTMDDFGRGTEDPDPVKQALRVLRDEVLKQLSYQMRAANAPMGAIYNGRDLIVVERVFEFDIEQLRLKARQQNNDLEPFGYPAQDLDERGGPQHASQSDDGATDEASANSSGSEFPSPPSAKRRRLDSIALSTQPGVSDAAIPSRRSERLNAGKGMDKNKSFAKLRTDTQQATSTTKYKPLDVDIKLMVWDRSFGHPSDLEDKERCDRQSPAYVFAAAAKRAAHKLEERPDVLDDDVVDFVRASFLLRGGRCNCMMAGEARPDYPRHQRQDCADEAMSDPESGSCGSKECCDDDDDGDEPDVLALKRRHFLENMVMRLKQEQEACKADEPAHKSAQGQSCEGDFAGTAAHLPDLFSLLQRKVSLMPCDSDKGRSTGAFAGADAIIDLRKGGNMEEGRSAGGFCVPESLELQARHNPQSHTAKTARQCQEHQKRRVSQQEGTRHSPTSGSELRNAPVRQGPFDLQPCGGQPSGAPDGNDHAEEEFLIAFGVDSKRAVMAEGVGDRARYWILVCPCPFPPDLVHRSPASKNTPLQPQANRLCQDVFAAEAPSDTSTLVRGKLWTMPVPLADAEQGLNSSRCSLTAITGFFPGMVPGRLYRTALTSAADCDMATSLALVAQDILGHLMRADELSSASLKDSAMRGSHAAFSRAGSFEQLRCTEVELKLPELSTGKRCCDSCGDTLEDEIQCALEDPYAYVEAESLLAHEYEVLYSVDASEDQTSSQPCSDPTAKGGLQPQWKKERRKREQFRQRLAEHDSWRLWGCPDGLCDVLFKLRPKGRRRTASPAEKALDSFEQEEAARHAPCLASTTQTSGAVRSEQQQIEPLMQPLVTVRLQIRQDALDEDGGEGCNKLLRRLADVVVPVLACRGPTLADLFATLRSRSSLSGTPRQENAREEEDEKVLELLRSSHSAVEAVQGCKGWAHGDEGATKSLIESWAKEVHSATSQHAAKCSLGSVRDEAMHQLRSLHEKGFALRGMRAAKIALRLEQQKARVSGSPRTRKIRKPCKTQSRTAASDLSTCTDTDIVFGEAAQPTGETDFAHYNGIGRRPSIATPMRLDLDADADEGMGSDVMDLGLPSESCFPSGSSDALNARKNTGGRHVRKVSPPEVTSSSSSSSGSVSVSGSGSGSGSGPSCVTSPSTTIASERGVARSKNMLPAASKVVGSSSQHEDSAIRRRRQRQERSAFQLGVTLVTPGSSSYVRREDAARGGGLDAEVDGDGDGDGDADADADADLWWASACLADVQALELAFEQLEAALRGSYHASRDDLCT